MELFEQYVKQFDMNLDGIKFKYHHSYRVQEYAQKIAESLEYNKKDYKLVSICGLFHDIGRFPQFQKYHSFEDHKTIDHGDLGYDILKKDIIDKLDLDDEEKRILLLSIKYHNKINIKDDLTGKALEICNIIRDADKLDIISSFPTQIITKEYLNKDITISDKCHQSFLNHEQIKRPDVKTKGDHILIQLGFIWDFNYTKSYEILNDNKLFSKIKDIMSEPSFDVYFQMIEEKIKEELA